MASLFNITLISNRLFASTSVQTAQPSKRLTGKLSEYMSAVLHDGMQGQDVFICLLYTSDAADE